MSETITYSTEDFLKAFGAEPSDAEYISEEVGKYDFRYTRLAEAEHLAIVSDIDDKIKNFTQVGSHRQNIWESCWHDVKKNYVEEGSELTALDPKFMGAHQVIRLHGEFVRPLHQNFETHWFRVYRQWLFRTYLEPFQKVMEFGCGSGFNLAFGAKLYPSKDYVGLDWSQSSVDLINSIAADHGYSLSGRKFNFFDPDPSVEMDSNTIVMTFSALEQTGERFDTFAEWLLEKKPGLVLSMEPISEFYDMDDPFDKLAFRYHKHRQYLTGYYSWLKKKEEEGKIDILKAHRPAFGNIYQESYSFVVWRPK